MKKDTMGDRFKQYEWSYNIKMPRRLPVIIRIDGKAFHTMVKRWELNKPYDYRFMDVMNITAETACQEIQGAEFAYIQSDEINILVHNYKRINTEAWFDNKVQKIVSVSASKTTKAFNFYHRIWRKNIIHKKFSLQHCAEFDARVFVLPEHEVCNYFIWRQKDWMRNSLSMLARSLYSHKELEGKGREQLHDMIHTKGDNWAKYPTSIKNGRACYKKNGVWVIDIECPVFTKERNYIEQWLETEEEK